MANLPTPQRLRPGRHRLPREDVTRSQRERLLVATIHAVAELGYPAVTVADIVARASVSRSTFYAQFADRDACFVAAYDYAMRHALERLEAEAGPRPALSWRERVRRDLTAYLAVLADEPALARVLHVEVLAAGTVALDHRAQLLGTLAARIANLGEGARREDDEVRALPPAVFALFTGGLDELIRDRLRTASSAGLADLAEPVLEATYAMFGA